MEFTVSGRTTLTRPLTTTLIHIQVDWERKSRNFFADADLVKLGEVFDSIQLVKQDDIVTEDIAENIPVEFQRQLCNGGQKTFYNYLRNAQGDLSVYLNGLKYMIDNHDFIKNSLFCEWGIHRQPRHGQAGSLAGFSEVPHERQSLRTTRDEDGYYPCEMVAEFTQEEIKSGAFDKFVEVND